MVKVAENKVVDLDILPGNKQGDQIAEQAKYVKPEFHLMPLTVFRETELPSLAIFPKSKPRESPRTPATQLRPSEVQ